MFSNQMWLDTRKNVFCRVFFPLDKSLLDVMVLKKLQVLQSRSKNAQRVILLFNVLDIIFLFALCV